MAVEILPTTEDGLDESVATTWTPDDMEVERLTISGPRSAVETSYTNYKNIARLTGRIASIDMEKSRGRARMIVNYAREKDGGITADDEAIMELAQASLAKDIVSASYFKTLTNPQISAVRRRIDEQLDVDVAWSDLQKSLYGHILHGQAQYWETVYILRMSWKTAIIRELQIASSDPNTVVELPTLTTAMQTLIDELPTGEWLKRPTVVQSAGNGFYSVQVEYNWADEWSAIYGGTFTGIDA